MEGVRQCVEQACLDFQNPSLMMAAEAAIVAHLRDAPHALLAGQHILANSVLPEARFHAAVGLKRAIMLRWAGLSLDERLAFRVFLLQFIRNTAHDPQHLLVHKHLCAAFAVAMKLGWLSDSPEVKAQLLQEVHAMVMSGSQALLAVPGAAAAAASANGDAQAVAAAQGAGVAGAGSLPVGRAGLQVLEAVVEEFGLGSASPLGLPWDFHEKCCRDMEDHYLHSFFATAIGLGQQALHFGGVLQGADSGVCRAAIALLAQCMQWEFRRPGLPSVLAGASSKRVPGDCSHFAPGESWSEMLLAPATTEWVVALLQQIQAARAGSTGRGPDHLEALANEARQLFVGFCSLSRDVFPRPLPRVADPVAASPKRHAFLTTLMRVLLPDLHPPGAVLQQARANDGQPLQDACKCVAALASTHRAHHMQAASLEALGGPAAPAISGASSGTGGIIGVLEVLTVAAIGAGGARQGDDLEGEGWLRESTDMLMDEAEEDEHEETAAASAENWVCRAASLSRASPTICLPFMAACMNQAKDALAFAATSGSDTSEALEQLSWLQRAVAHCLADPGSGEVPMMPQPLAQAIGAGVPGVAEAVLCCCESLLAVPALVLNDAARGAMSPRLLEASVWALARWSETYLFPEESLPGALQVVYGDVEASQSVGGTDPTAYPPGASSKALATLDMLVQIASTCLVAYPGEGMLHKQVCTVLLPALVRHPGICNKLQTLPSWRALVTAFAQRQAVITARLGLKLQRALAQSLCLAASGINRSSAAHEYVGTLISPTAHEVAALASQPNLAELSARANAANALCSCLETLRGATCATLARTQAPLWAMTASLLGPLLALQRAFKHHTLVVALILKLAGNIVENHVSYLKPHEGGVLLQWVLVLLQQYAEDNQWVKEGAASKSLVYEGKLEAARDLRALLRLLGHVTQRDLSEAVSGVAAATQANSHCHYSGPPGTQHSDVSTAQVVVLGLNILLPLMTTDLLKFPKLCSLYYNLLVYVLENYPEQVVGLPAYHFGTLMSSLEFGLACSSDGMVVGNALEGLTGLAHYQQTCRVRGIPGLNVHSPPGGPSVTTAIMERILRLVLLEDTSYDLVEMASNALQLLILAEPDAYVLLAKQLVQQAHQRDSNSSAHLEGALSGLLQQANLGATDAVQPSLPKPVQKAFKEALSRIVQDIRGIIRLK
ncbi:hypothetical protein DUNSADRAFT_14821 [Dunaliella salina]|uniref:Exportin-4 n=1 Tax=Dunaliella salina TaxID=3046 RepID=A0ABQ7G6M1_DUNSA|nr:hypothetical protein DUNSADRAFT_14821 [Dunaliella salina]|eukprot:KAF5830248.1 hypothetical protein DUNSADRAFT_14821 [Dunaliella salina]